jgi:hypothetical protein
MGDGCSPAPSPIVPLNNQVMKCEMCTERTLRGKATVEVQTMTRHVRRIALQCSGAVALGAALESAVQLGRGDDLNRQAQVANLTNVGPYRVGCSADTPWCTCARGSDLNMHA